MDLTKSMHSFIIEIHRRTEQNLKDIWEAATAGGPGGGWLGASLQRQNSPGNLTLHTSIQHC